MPHNNQPLITSNLRLAAHLASVGHSIQKISLNAEGYGEVLFSPDARPDADAFELGARAPSKALLEVYRHLITRVAQLRDGVQR